LFSVGGGIGWRVLTDFGRYIYKGNSKFGAISIENLEGGDQSSLKYRLYVDGKEVWNTVVLSPPPPAHDKFGGSFWDKFKIGG
jgi:alkaline phosphatase D